MSEPKSLKKALLEQERLEPGGLSDSRRKEIEMMLTREQKRIREMRWVTAMLWVLWIAGYLLGAIAALTVGRLESLWFTVLGAVWMLLFPLAIVSTILLYVRWRAVTRKEIRLRLSGIEERLNRMSDRLQS